MSTLNLSPIGSNGLPAMENLSLQSAQIEGAPSAAWYYETLGASPNALQFNTQALQQQTVPVVQQPTPVANVSNNTNTTTTTTNNYSWIWRYVISGALIAGGGVLLFMGYNNYSKSHKYYKPKGK